MDTHGLGAVCDHLWECMERIKVVSSSTRACDYASEAQKSIKILVSSLDLDDAFRVHRERRADPTM